NLFAISQFSLPTTAFPCFRIVTLCMIISNLHEEARIIEKVNAVFPNGSTGVFGSEVYDVVLTDARLILAVTSKEQIKEALEKSREASKEKGEGFFKKIGSTIKASAAVQDRYHEMSPADIVAENPGNISIPLSSVKSVRVKNTGSSRTVASVKGVRVGVSFGGGTTTNTGRFRQLMTIKWAGSDPARPQKIPKTKLTFSSLDVKEARGLLKEHFEGVAK
ncbi:MAG TPA: hypothetical protein DCE14_08940, partial [Kosmotogaceae bacterium]|nr:hypothetical protein [Kosmotogaceae bacterium]